MFDESKEHDQHDVKRIGGDDPDETNIAMDEIIQFALKTLEKREQEVVNAKEVKDDINEIREKFVGNSKARIERIVNDLRVAMEDCAGQLLREVNKKVGDMELKCQSVITTSRVKLDTIKQFIQHAATALPDDEGRLDSKQLARLYAYYKTLQNMESQPRTRLKHVDVNVKYPNSYQRKSECQALAKSICGQLEDPKRNSFLHLDDLPPGMEEDDVITPLVKPKRKASRDLLKN